MYACMYVGRSVCMCVCMHVCMHVCMYVHILIFVHLSVYAVHVYMVTEVAAPKIVGPGGHLGFAS